MLDMSNILSVIPAFDITTYSHILPSLEKALISTADLLSVSHVDIAKRASIPPGEVKKLCDALLEALHTDNLKRKTSLETDADGSSYTGDSWRNISTLDDTLDSALGGGIGPGYITEIVGER